MKTYNLIYHHRTQGTGAEGVHIAYVIKGLQKLGHHVEVISPNDIDPSQTAGDNPYGKREGLRPWLLNYLSRILPQFLFECLEMIYNWTATGKLEARLMKGDIDLIYERNAFFLKAGARVARKHNVPFIVEVNEIVGEVRVRKQFFVTKARRIEQFVFQQADAILVVSEFLKDKIVANGIDAGKIHVIPNATDPEVFHGDLDGTAVRRNLGISDNTIVFGFVGWFIPWHRLPELVQAFANVARGRDACLMLVGDGSLGRTLRQLSHDLNVGHQVIFAGAVKYQDIPHYIAAMDIGVVPGSNAYRSPIKLFEYMGMAKAVLAPALPPITSIVTHGHNGHIFSQDDPASLRTGIERLLTDHGYRRALGEMARQKVLHDHTWDGNAQRIISIYEDIAGYSGSQHNQGVAES